MTAARVLLVLYFALIGVIWMTKPGEAIFSALLFAPVFLAVYGVYAALRRVLRAILTRAKP